MMSRKLSKLRLHLRIVCLISNSRLRECEDGGKRFWFYRGVVRMGSHMSRRLVAANHKVVVFDADPCALQRATAAGASAAHSPADVASQTEIVMVSLPTPDIVSTVALSSNGVAMGTKIKTFIDLSTTGPRVASEVAKVWPRRESLPWMRR